MNPTLSSEEAKAEARKLRRKARLEAMTDDELLAREERRASAKAERLANMSLAERRAAQARRAELLRAYRRRMYGGGP